MSFSLLNIFPVLSKIWPYIVYMLKHCEVDHASGADRESDASLELMKIFSDHWSFFPDLSTCNPSDRVIITRVIIRSIVQTLNAIYTHRWSQEFPLDISRSEIRAQITKILSE